MLNLITYIVLYVDDAIGFILLFITDLLDNIHVFEAVLIIYLCTEPILYRLESCSRYAVDYRNIRCTAGLYLLAHLGGRVELLNR